MGDLKRALGLMSGTSMDGIDVAMIETDGEDRVERGAARTFAYTAEVRSLLAAAIGTARDLRDRQARPGIMREAERVITKRHAEAVTAFLAAEGIPPESIDVIGFHGQTVLHRPGSGLTVQLGDGAGLAELTGLPVVFDLRAADMADGGQGAPLVPIYHRALAGVLPGRPLALLNLGGVANITFIGANGELIAFDTGPGSALIDDWVSRCTKGAKSFDRDGAMAARGQVSEDVVSFFAAHEYFAQPPPKSLDRNSFFWDLVEWMSPDDGAATLTAMSAEAVRRAMVHLPAPPVRIVACGGGRRNTTLVAMIAARTGIEVVGAEAVGFDGDSVEAEAWAYLGVRAQLGLPITFPGTTGVKAARSGGIVAPPAPAS
ncbi:MAG: anhydro-N-acetylmuramic acid kinase [Alphaproteobacteria bacterium]|nr:anhydro-N-acetylmuramic acid kinase [Alphaproteobacteria bacterium]